jgi:hypothetical protein
MSCQVCRAEAATRYVEFYSNIGILFRRVERSIKGHLCKSCIASYFWEFTLTSLFLGWWGVISLLVNPFFILNNVFRFLGCLFMPGAPGGAATAPSGSLQSYLETIRTRLNAGVGLLQVSQEISEASGYHIEDVYPYVMAVSRDNIRRHSPAS